MIKSLLLGLSRRFPVVDAVSRVGVFVDVLGGRVRNILPPFGGIAACSARLIIVIAELHMRYAR